MPNILEKIEQEKLIGRGGACFPVHIKWKSVKNCPAEKKFVVCNASEGEPDVLKDGYLFENFPEKIIDGINLAIKEIKAEKAFIFIGEKYYKKYSKRLLHLISDSKIELFLKPHIGGYIAGEESALLNAIEKLRIEPRRKPPYPSEKGLWGYPTIINNVETFYNVSLVNSNEYKNNRFFSIVGDCHWPGVYESDENDSIENILKLTKNYPNFDFFVQIGGGASGEVLNSNQLGKPVSGSGSITIYSKSKHKPINVIKKWLDFFMNESCGQCTPCREGTYRLLEIIKGEKPNWKMFFAILADLPETSFCALGASVPTPIISYFNNVLVDSPEYNSIYTENK